MYPNWFSCRLLPNFSPCLKGCLLQNRPQEIPQAKFLIDYRFVPFVLCSFPYRLGRQVSTIGCILTVTYVMYQNQNPVKSLYFPFVLPASLLLFYLSFSLPQYYLNLFLSQSGRQVHSLSHVYFINIDRPTPLMY
jgi:hypothetical protein